MTDPIKIQMANVLINACTVILEDIEELTFRPVTKIQMAKHLRNNINRALKPLYEMVDEAKKVSAQQEHNGAVLHKTETVY